MTFQTRVNYYRLTTTPPKDKHYRILSYQHVPYDEEISDQLVAIIENPISIINFDEKQVEIYSYSVTPYFKLFSNPKIVFYAYNPLKSNKPKEAVPVQLFRRKNFNNSMIFETQASKIQ